MAETITVSTSEAQKKSAEHLDRLERQVLANMANYPEIAFKTVVDVGIMREYFDNPRHASAFSAMLKCAPDDSKAIKKALLDAMGDELKTNEQMDEFWGLAVSSYKVNAYIVEFAQYIVRLQGARKMFAAFSDNRTNPRDTPDICEQITNEMRERINAIERFRGGKSEADGEFDGTIPTPEELMDVPGFVNAMVKHTLAASHRPNRVLAFTGALAMLSHLVGRKYTDSRGAMPNLYLVALANSGVGKDDPRKVNKALADRIEALNSVADQIGSGEGLEDALFQSPKLLFQMDEFDTLLNALKESTSINEHIYTYLLTFFSESGSIHSMRCKALSQDAKEAMAANPTAVAKKPSLKIFNPSLTLYATAIPSRFYSALSMRSLENGLLARCLVFEAGKRNPAADQLTPIDQLPDEVLNFAQFTADADTRLQWGARITMTCVPDDEGVAEIVKQIITESDEYHAKADKKDDIAGMAIWSRTYEISCKLALLYALSENLANPKITVRGFKWAWELVQYSAKRMLAMAQAYIFTDKQDDNCNKIMRYLKRQPGKKAMRGDISYSLHIGKRDMNEAEATLLDRGEIKVVPVGKGVLYRATAKKRGR